MKNYMAIIEALMAEQESNYLRMSNEGGLAVTSADFTEQVEEKVFSISHGIRLGPAENIRMAASPLFTFKPQYMAVNLPCPTLLSLSGIILSNVDVLHTAEWYTRTSNVSPPDPDAYEFCSTGRGATGLFPLDPRDGEVQAENPGYGYFPIKALTIGPQHKITVVCRYSGFIPHGFKEGDNFDLRFDFRGLGI